MKASSDGTTRLFPSLQCGDSVPGNSRVNVSEAWQPTASDEVATQVWSAAVIWRQKAGSLRDYSY